LLIRSVSGVRGLAANEITPDVARHYARAFAGLHPGDIAVGWDSRPGGDVLVAAVADGVGEAGGRPLLTGVVPTPTVGLAVRRHGLAGGVVVTASHNPVEYNGLKFFSSRGVFLESDEVGRLFEIVDATPPGGSERRGELSGSAHSGGDSLAGVVEEHIELILASPFVDVEAVSSRRPRVVVDAVNGAGSVILPSLLRRMGCDVVEMNTDAGAGFPRGAEPIPEHLEDLGRAVVAEVAAIGLACDPDGDRLAMVDEAGRAVGEELTLAISTRVVLDVRPGPIVANVSTSRMMDDLAQEFGVPIHWTRIGEINVVAKMLEVGAVVGGEGNGGVVLPDVHPGRDAATAAALVLTGLSRCASGRPSDLVSAFVPYASVKTKLAAPALDRQDIVDAMRRAFPDGALDLTDGAKIAWPDRWIHARMSGTEPVVRVIAEAASEEVARTLVDEAVSAVTMAAEGA
jgi:phosphomannomutase